MKTSILALIGLSATISAAPAELVEPAAPTTRHFYSPDPNGEYARQVGFVGASNLVGYGLSQKLPGTTELYRCRNVGADLWLVTTDANCEGASGFQLEGNMMYIYTSQVAGTQPLDRYVKIVADHLYTRRDYWPNAPEGYACDYGYYNQEGTTGFVFTSAGANTLPLYGFRKGKNKGTGDRCAGDNQ